jgi:hypothetical protein
MYRVGQSDRVDEFADISVDEYADQRGLDSAIPTMKEYQHGNNHNEQSRLNLRLSTPSRTVSAPRENVPLVPSKNVPLTGASWEGERTGSSHHELARTGPAGSAQEVEKETDTAGAGSRGAGHHSPAGKAADAPFAEGRGQGGDSRSAGPGIEAQAVCRRAGRDRADSVAGSIPGLRADAGQRVPGQQTQR